MPRDVSPATKLCRLFFNSFDAGESGRGRPSPQDAGGVPRWGEWGEGPPPAQHETGSFRRLGLCGSNFFLLLSGSLTIHWISEHRLNDVFSSSALCRIFVDKTGFFMYEVSQHFLCHPGPSSTPTLILTSANAPPIGVSHVPGSWSWMSAATPRYSWKQRSV